MLFLGTFDYAMDERGRVPLPPRYRDVFRAGIVLSQGSPDPCVHLYTAEAFETQAKRYLAVPALSRKGRQLRRLLSRTWEAQLDAQNRILIPTPLRSYAKLSGKVFLIGAGERMELWSPDAYEGEMDSIDENLEPMLESVSEREQ